MYRYSKHVCMSYPCRTLMKICRVLLNIKNLVVYFQALLLNDKEVQEWLDSENVPLEKVQVWLFLAVFLGTAEISGLCINVNLYPRLLSDFHCSKLIASSLVTPLRSTGMFTVFWFICLRLSRISEPLKKFRCIQYLT